MTTTVCPPELLARHARREPTTDAENLRVRAHFTLERLERKGPGVHIISPDVASFLSALGLVEVRPAGEYVTDDAKFLYDARYHAAVRVTSGS